MKVLIVDGANVVGSRPDGWWRDRGRAARRLWEQLIEADLPHDEVVLVLEGGAKKGVAASGRESRVQILHAPGSGDDAIVAETRARVRDGWDATAVTADRELAARVEAAGGNVTGPFWLLEQL
jgi:hypothetical protein